MEHVSEWKEHVSEWKPDGASEDGRTIGLDSAETLRFVRPVDFLADSRLGGFKGPPHWTIDLSPPWRPTPDPPGKT